MLNAAKKSAETKTLDVVVADEPNCQPHLKNLLSSPAVLTEPWKATSRFDGWQIPESVSEASVHPLTANADC